jgi:hypothetical protein
MIVDDRSWYKPVVERRAFTDVRHVQGSITLQYITACHRAVHLPLTAQSTSTVPAYKHNVIVQSLERLRPYSCTRNPVRMVSVAVGPHRAGWLRQGGWNGTRQCTVARFQRVAQQQQTIDRSTSDIGEGIHVQLEYYQLLHLPRFAAVSSVQQSYQRLLEDDKDFLGYSEVSTFM